MKVSRKLHTTLDELYWDRDSTACFSTERLLVRSAESCGSVGETEEWSAMRSWPRYDHLGENEWKVVWFCDSPGIEPVETIKDGIIRRILKESPVELASRLSVGARIHALTTQTSANDHFDELWRNVLNAATACDWFAVERLLDLWCSSNEKPNNRTYAMICDSLTALFHGDARALESHVDKIRNRKEAAYCKAILNAFVAIADGEPDAYRDAIVKMVRGYKSYMFGDEIDGLIDVHALGLVHLSARFKPEITSSLDTGHRLPWDGEYFEWSTTVGRLIDYFEFPNLPDWLEPHLVKMERIDWGDKIRQQWSSL